MAPTVYGVILHWDEHTDYEGELIPAQDFFFVSPDAESYLEVSRLPIIPHEAAGKLYHDELTEHMTEGRRTDDGKRFLPMTFVRRFFSQQEQRPEQRVTFDGRLWPPVTKKPNGSDPTEYGLPADVSYPNIGMTPVAS